MKRFNFQVQACKQNRKFRRQIIYGANHREHHEEPNVEVTR